MSSEKETQEMASRGVNVLIEQMEYSIGKVGEANEALEEIRLALREVQTMSPGAVLLELHNCTQGCAGCPHPSWKQWYSRPAKRRAARRSRKEDGQKMAWVAKRISYPIRSIRQSPTYTTEAEDLIVQALDLIRRRKALLKWFKSVWLAARNQTTENSAFKKDE